MGTFEGSGKLRHSDAGGLELSVDGGVTWVAVGGGGGLGADTTIPQLNSGGQSVNALRLRVSLTTTTPLSEASQWLLTTLSAGAPVDCLQIGPAQLQAPGGTAALPGYGFIGHSGTGMSYDGSAFAGVSFSAGGTEQLKLSGLLNAAMLTPSAATLFFSTSQTEFINRTGLSLGFTANNSERFRINSTGLSFHGSTPVAKGAITGSKGANAALASLLTYLASTGLLTDSTT